MALYMDTDSNLHFNGIPLMHFIMFMLSTDIQCYEICYALPQFLSESVSSDKYTLPLVAKLLNKNASRRTSSDVWLGLHGLFYHQRVFLYYLFGQESLRIYRSEYKHTKFSWYRKLQTSLLFAPICNKFLEFEVTEPCNNTKQNVN